MLCQGSSARVKWSIVGRVLGEWSVVGWGEVERCAFGVGLSVVRWGRIGCPWSVALGLVWIE